MVTKLALIFIVAAAAWANPTTCIALVPGEQYVPDECPMIGGPLVAGSMVTNPLDFVWVGSCVADSYFIPEGVDYDLLTVKALGFWSVYSGAESCAPPSDPPTAVPPNTPLPPDEPPTIAQVPEPYTAPVVGMTLLIVGAVLMRRKDSNV